MHMQPRPALQLQHLPSRCWAALERTQRTAEAGNEKCRVLIFGIQEVLRAAPRTMTSRPHPGQLSRSQP